MMKKTIAISLLVMLMLAFVVSPSSAACSKTKTCANGACTTGCTAKTACNTCGTCSNKDICITYMQCSGKEYIKITNSATTAKSLKGFKIGIMKCKNCKEVKYSVPAVTVKSGKCVYLYTGKGKNSGCSYFLGTSGNVLNCKGNTVKLYNYSGAVISTKTN